MPPREFVDPKGHQRHHRPASLALQQRFRTWPVAQRHALPQPRLQLLGAAQACSTNGERVCLLDRLSVLLLTTAGIQGSTPERVFRWTATGGNIGSVNAFLVVRDCPGLDPALYAYAQADHQLARLAPLDAVAVPANAPVSIVLTGDYGKLSLKYSVFALRIVLLDAGCAVATASRVCDQLGIDLSLPRDWDDEAIAAFLGVDPDLEPVTAILHLGEAL